jgi:hypothetical protein
VTVEGKLDVCANVQQWLGRPCSRPTACAPYFPPSRSSPGTDDIPGNARAGRSGSAGVTGCGQRSADEAGWRRDSKKIARSRAWPTIACAAATPADCRIEAPLGPRPATARRSCLPGPAQPRNARAAVPCRPSPHCRSRPRRICVAMRYLWIADRRSARSRRHRAIGQIPPDAPDAQTLLSVTETVGTTAQWLVPTAPPSTLTTR